MAESLELMPLDVLLLLVGGAMLYFGAEWLVSGAAGIARVFGVTPLVVGLTVVSYGTSAPELAVSLTAATNGQSAIALGNVIGSNIANVALILGVTALLAPPRVDGALARRELPFLLVATLALGPLLYDGQIGRDEGAFLFAGAMLFTFAAFRWAKSGSRQEDTTQISENGKKEPQNRLRLVGLFVVGLGTLVLGGNLFVDGAIGVAKTLGMSERLVGLTIVAFGTSLPELAASLVAALRGHSDLAVGNVVGSNLFNLLLILGATSLVSPIYGDLSEVVFDLGAMTCLTFFMAVSMRKTRQISRVEGGILATCYVGFIVALVVNG